MIKSRIPQMQRQCQSEIPHVAEVGFPVHLQLLDSNFRYYYIVVVSN